MLADMLRTAMTDSWSGRSPRCETLDRRRPATCCPWCEGATVHTSGGPASMFLPDLLTGGDANALRSLYDEELSSVGGAFDAVNNAVRRSIATAAGQLA